MSMKYPHLLSPVRVGNMTLKNRLISGNSLPHFLQGPEPYPAEPVINHVVTMAKNGAAVVTFADWTNMGQRESKNEDGRRFPMFTLDTDPSVENYLCQLADQVHYYNSRISLALMPFFAPDPEYDVNADPAVDTSNLFFAKFGERVYDNYGMNVLMRNGAPSKELTHEMIRDIIETQAQRARKYQLLGFDMVTLHFAYRATLFARFLSPRSNHRTDEYGGPIENRARFLLELCLRIKELCGRDFPIEVQLTGSEEGGNTIEDTIRLAKLAEGYVDIFQFRADTANLNHPTGYNSREHTYAVLNDCAAIKASGTKILCEPIGGFQDIDDMEAALREGQADLIGGARMFICDFDFYTKLKEGRADDVFPCIRCNKCHVPSLTGDWLSFCTVNPRMGIEHRLEKLMTPASASKKIAVVGGGFLIKSLKYKSSVSRNNTRTAAERVYDLADVLTDEEERLLTDYIAESEARAQIDIIVVTINLPMGLSDYQWTDNMVNYADDFYDNYAFGWNEPYGDGALILDNWYEDENGSQKGSWLSTSGKMEEYIGIYDPDSSYAHALCTALGKCSNVTMEIVEFTKPESIEFFAMKKSVRSGIYPVGKSAATPSTSIRKPITK